jgi:hypothetical protein
MHEKHIENDKWGDWYTADFILAMIVSAFQVLFIYIEAHQLHFHGWKYWSSFWNLLDLASIGLNIATVVVDVIIDNDDQDANAVACMAALVIWFRFFYLLRVFSETAYLVSMIEAIIWQMKYFVLALIIAIIAFANTFFILGRNSDGDNFAGNNVWYAFLFSYRMGLGDFDTDGFGTDDEVLIWVLWFLNTIAILIIMLNLVIAIMGDIFGKVQEVRKATMLQEFSSIMRENDFLFNRESIFKGCKYIIVIDTEKAEGEQDGDWEGRVNELKKFLDESSQKHMVDMNKSMDKQQKFVTSTLEKKFKPYQNKIKNKISNLEHRLQKNLDFLAEYRIEKKQSIF